MNGLVERVRTTVFAALKVSLYKPDQTPTDSDV